MSVLTHSDVINYASKWVKRKFPLVFKEWAWSGQEQPDIFAVNYSNSCIVEAKVSRSDYRADFKKPFRKDISLGMGDFRFYACPEGLITLDDFTEQMKSNWGLLYINEKGKVKCIHNPFCEHPDGNIWHNQNIKCKKAEYGIMYSIMRKFTEINKQQESIINKLHDLEQQEIITS